MGNTNFDVHIQVVITWQNNINKKIQEMEIIPVFHDIKTQTHPVKFKTGIVEFRLWHHIFTNSLCNILSKLKRQLCQVARVFIKAPRLSSTPDIELRKLLMNFFIACSIMHLVEMSLQSERSICGYSDLLIPGPNLILHNGRKS